MIRDPDPALFVCDFQEANKKKIFAYYFLQVYFYQSSKLLKVKPLNNRNQGFSSLFCLLMEGSEAGSGSVQIITDPDPGGPKTYGSSGSGTLQVGLYFSSETCLRNF
jgi:hypothetical protein